MSNINLLPWRIYNINYQNHIFGAGCALIAVLIVVVGILLNISIGVILNNQEKDLKYLEDEIGKYTIKIKEINGLKERKKMLLNRLEVINSLQSQRSVMVNILDKVALAVPSGIALKKMQTQEGILTIAGNSESNSRVSIFMRNLESSSLFANPRLKEIKSSQNNNDEQFADFELEVNIVG